MADPASDYWNEAKTPLASLCFLIPWIAFYEFGVLAAEESDSVSLRNGADFWMRSVLEGMGFGPVLLPLFVLFLLMLWHLFRGHPWRMRLETQCGMLAESVLLAVALIAVGQCHDFLFRQLHVDYVHDAPVVNAMSTPFAKAVSFIGAGVYEEFMFRFLLVPAAIVGFRMFEFPPKPAAAMAALFSSFLFALAHHVGPAAEPFSLFAFSFRAAAGLFFAAIFLMRGFGITVGCHAAYDLLAGMVLIPG